MKAHEFKHSRSAAPRQGLALCLLALLLFGAAPALPQSGSARQATAIDLVCPCSIESVGEKSIRVKASIKNKNTVASRELLFGLEVYQHGFRERGQYYRYRERGWYFYGGGRYFDLAVYPPVAAGKTAKVDVLMTLDSELSRSENISWSTHGVHALWLAEIFRYEEHINDGRSFYGSDVRGQVIFPPVGEEGFSETLTSIDYLTDTDKDGVTDYNERLMNTKPDDANDKPGTVTLDIMAVYTADLKARYQGEPLSCMAHSLEWANMALKNSSIDARFRFVRTRGLEAGVVPPGVWADAWNFVQRQEGLFDSISDERLKAGADLLVLFHTTSGGSANVPSLSRIMGYDDFEDEGKERHLKERPLYEFENTKSQSACGGPGSGIRNSVLAHELGHNLGLLHSVRQNNAWAVFKGARGHGEDGDFATVMAYPSAYDTDLRVQYYSNPKVDLCGSSKSRPCGVEMDEALAADAAGAIRAVMYKVAQWAPDPLDSDGDGTVDFFDVFPNDSTEWWDSDGDKIGDNADMDDDNDGLTDAEEKALGTDPKDEDTDNDGVIDRFDRYPSNYLTSGYDADNDGVDAAMDANDNDPGVKWTRSIVTLTPDATIPANLIATFDDTTEDIAAIRANTEKYELTGMFADASLTSWNDGDAIRNEVNSHPDSRYALVGNGSVRTGRVGGMTGSKATGSIKIKGVMVKGGYISFLMVGGNHETDVGINLYEAGTSNLLSGWKSNLCFSGLGGDFNWKHFNVRALAGQSVDIEIYDNSDDSGMGMAIESVVCGSVAFDHLYQSDYARGELVGTAIAPPDMDGDGLSDAWEATLGTNPLLADTDGDGLSDAWEATLGTNPLVADSDGDNVNDGADAFPLDRNEITDTDGDRIGNNADPDDDNDGLTDIEEAALGTNPLLADTDGDNVNDGADAFPLDRNEITDTDGDRIGNNADPDDDNDGLTDIEEVALGTNSLLADTDGDNVNDGADAFPLDRNEITDTDGDRIGNNADPDDDNDGLTDIEEAALGTNPLLADTDGDGVNDIRDIAPMDITVAYEPDRHQVLLPGGRDARNVVADFDDLAEIRAKIAKYELTGVFADPSLANWNRFEAEDEAAGVGN